MYAIEFELNSDDNTVNNSINVYLQNVERKLSKLLRSPAQKITRTLPIRTGRANEAIVDIPVDMLDVVHLRANADDSGYGLESQAAIVIQRSDRTSFERLRQLYVSNGYYIDNVLEFDYPIYVLNDSEFQITPRPSTDVTEVEIHILPTGS